MATFWERTAPSFDHKFSLYFDCLVLVISRFGFEVWLWGLIASVPDLGIHFTFKQDVCGVNAHTFICLCMNIDKPE